jgi:hypothetical protein
VVALAVLAVGSLAGLALYRYFDKMQNADPVTQSARVAQGDQQNVLPRSDRATKSATTKDTAPQREARSSPDEVLEEDVPRVQPFPKEESTRELPRLVPPIFPKEESKTIDAQKPPSPRRKEPQPRRPDQQTERQGDEHPPQVKAKSPPAKKEEGPPPKESPARREEPSDRLKALVATLKSRKQEERLQACEQLESLGKAALPAVRALCEATLDPSQKVARAALQALEKVHPDLHQSVLVLLVDDNADNHVRALAKLGQLGEAGNPAVPIILLHIRKHLEYLSDPNIGRTYTSAQLVASCMEVLPRIAPEDPDVVKALIGLTKAEITGDILIRRRDRRTDATTIRNYALELLGTIAEAQPKHRKQIVPPLVTVFKEAVERTNDPNNNHSVQTAITELSLAGDALVKCGADAKESLDKEVLPLLKELKFHRSEQVRKTAEQLREKIEKGG